MKNKTDAYEKDTLEAYEESDFESIPDVLEEMAKYREYAKYTMQKNKRINIRISERDLMHIQREAVSEGIPYQTLISSILHKFVNGSLVSNPKKK